MRQYGLNMIAHTIQDPENIRSNNEVAKAQLKARLKPDSIPGPGAYQPEKLPPIGAASPRPAALEGPAWVKTIVDSRVMSKLGRRDRNAPSKALAFDSSSPRFKHGSDLAMVHARSRTLDCSKEDLSKPVYDLQMLEGPQVKVRNQLQTN